MKWYTGSPEHRKRASCMALSVYLAARFSRKDLMRQYREELAVLGIGVTSRWLDETVPGTVTLDEVAAPYKIKCASMDVRDIEAADVFVFFSEHPESLWPRGGRHVEFGYALALKKPIVVCGPRENVFHWSPGLRFCRTWSAVKKLLKEEKACLT